MHDPKVPKSSVCVIGHMWIPKDLLRNGCRKLGEGELAGMLKLGTLKYNL